MREGETTRPRGHWVNIGRSEKGICGDRKITELLQKGL